jgi:hypothetical protein
MGESAESFLKRSVTQGGRIVSSGDLNVYQISESQAKGNFWINSEGLGWAILPWSLTTDKDNQRESGLTKNLGAK